ncbi:deoxynucleoside triphosphate triphosphohydrolase SAMHD1-like [Tachysurus vachellii]|uniref:deoxynucleoside triphosphate triphosphohydrolase SAMHD1-like n=1 Tax=Tachysurus vachellii TaxID=175792 RepID=UPI00296AF8FC|nr:deoxynucleoside triphosphate triphosphohydrolase SAMHD1-like [Tachysurus vachellii]
MYELFHNRYMLHYTVYHHRVKVVIETIITDALVAAEDHYKLGGKTISEAVLDPKTFMKLTDDIVMNIMQSTNPNLNNSKKIIRRIRKRELYKFVGSKIFQTREINNLKTAQTMRDATERLTACECFWTGEGLTAAPAAR